MTPGLGIGIGIGFVVLIFFILGGMPPPQNGKIKPMKQQRQQHKNLFWQFIQLNIPMLRDVKGYMIVNIPLLSPRSALFASLKNFYVKIVT